LSGGQMPSISKEVIIKRDNIEYNLKRFAHVK